MKILKYLLIAFGIVLGGVAASFGYLMITGAFNPPDIMPEDVYFVTKENESGPTEEGGEIDKIQTMVYNTYENFQIKIGTTTEKVTRKSVKLSFPTTGIYSSVTTAVEGREGYITNGIITVPETVFIGTPFTVELVKAVDDRVSAQEDLDEDSTEETEKPLYNVGGECILNIQSANSDLTILKAYVNVDVPVESIEIVTKTKTTDVEEDETIANSFVIGSYFSADVVFTPQRSMYKFGRDGSRETTEYKTVLFDLPADETNILQQEEGGNVFSAERLTVSTGSTVKAYCYANSVYENNSVATSVYEKIDEMTKKTTDGASVGFSVEKSDIVIVDVDITKFTVNSKTSQIQLDLNKATTIYANREKASAVDNEFNLDVNVSSSNGQVHYSKISQIALSIEKYDTTAQRYVDASDIVEFVSAGDVREVNFGTKENPNVKKLYSPKINLREIRNSYWKLVTSSKVTGVKVFVYYLNADKDDVIVNGGNFGPYNYTIDVNAAYSSILSWNTDISLLTNKTIGSKLTNAYTIVDNSSLSAVKTVVINLENLCKITSDVSVPTGKYPTYTEIRYFIYKNEEFYDDAGADSGFEADLSKITNASLYNGKIDGVKIFGDEEEGVEEDGVLYEVESVNQLVISGISSINLFFVIIETDYKGNPIYDENGLYKVVELPQAHINNQQTLEYAPIEVSKTLKELNMRVNLVDETTNIEEKLFGVTEEGQNTDIYIVQGKDLTREENRTNEFTMSISSFPYDENGQIDTENGTSEFGIFSKEFKAGNIEFSAYTVKNGVESSCSALCYINDNDEPVDIKNYKYGNFIDNDRLIEGNQVGFTFYVGALTEFNFTNDNIILVRVYAKYKLNPDLNKYFEFYVYSGAVKDVYFKGVDDNEFRDMEIGTQTNPIYVKQDMSGDANPVVSSKYYLQGAQFNMNYDGEKYCINFTDKTTVLAQEGLLDTTSEKYVQVNRYSGMEIVGLFTKNINEYEIVTQENQSTITNQTVLYEKVAYGDMYIRQDATEYVGFNIASITVNGQKYTNFAIDSADKGIVYIKNFDIPQADEHEQIIAFIEFREKVEIRNLDYIMIEDYVEYGIEGFEYNDEISIVSSNISSIQVSVVNGGFKPLFIGSSNGAMVRITATPIHAYDENTKDTVYFIVESNFDITTEYNTESALSFDNNSKTFTFSGCYNANGGIDVRSLLTIKVNETDVTANAKFSHNITSVELLDKLLITSSEEFGVETINVLDKKDLGAGAYFNIIVSYEAVGYYTVIGIRLNAYSSLAMEVVNHEGAPAGEVGSFGVFAEADVVVNDFDYKKPSNVTDENFDYYVDVAGIEIKVETNKVVDLLTQYMAINEIVNEEDVVSEVRNVLKGLSVNLTVEDNKLKNISFGSVDSKTKFRIIIRRSSEFYYNLNNTIYQSLDTIQEAINGGEKETVDGKDTSIATIDGKIYKFIYRTSQGVITPLEAYELLGDNTYGTVNVFAQKFNQYGLEKVLVFYVSPNIKVSDKANENETITEKVENGETIYYLNDQNTAFKTGTEIHWGTENVEDVFTIVFGRIQGSNAFVTENINENDITAIYLLTNNTIDKSTFVVKVPNVETLTTNPLEFVLEYEGVEFIFRYYAKPNIVLSENAKVVTYNGKEYVALYQNQEVLKIDNGIAITKLYYDWFGQPVEGTETKINGATSIDFGVLSNTVINTQSSISTTTIKATSSIIKPQIGSWQKYEVTSENLLLSNVRVYQKIEDVNAYVDFDIILLPLEWEYLKYSDVEYTRQITIPDDYENSIFEVNVSINVKVSEDNFVTYTSMKAFETKNSNNVLVTTYNINLKDFVFKSNVAEDTASYYINKLDGTILSETYNIDAVATEENSPLVKKVYDVKNILNGVYKELFEGGKNYNLTSTITTGTYTAGSVTDNLQRIFNGKYTITYANQITTNFMKVTDLNGNDVSSFAVLKPVVKEGKTNAYDIILETKPVGEDKQIKVVITTQTYVINYYITICKTQKVVVYYPHINEETSLSDNLDEYGNVITDFENINTEHVFYEDFDANGKKYINLLAKDDENFNTNAKEPNNQGKRILVYVNDTVVNVPSELTYSVYVLKVNNNVNTNKNIINSIIQISSDGVITLNKVDETATMQIIIKIETINSSVNYYSLTIHKKDTSYALYKGEIDQTNNNEVQFDMNEQGKSYVLPYSLKKTEDGVINDATTKELKYAIISNQSMFTLDGFIITAHQSPNDEEATLIAYTRFGRVKSIKLVSKSSITYKIKETTPGSGVFKALESYGDKSVNIKDFVEIYQPNAEDETINEVSGSADLTWSISFENENAEKYINIPTNGIIDGSVFDVKPINKQVDVTAKIKIYGNSLVGTNVNKCYTFTLTFTLLPNIITNPVEVSTTYIAGENIDLIRDEAFSVAPGSAGNFNGYEWNYEVTYWNDDESDIITKDIETYEVVTGTNITFPSIRQETRAVISVYLEKNGVIFASSYTFVKVIPDIDVKITYPSYGTDQNLNNEYVFYGDYDLEGTANDSQLDLFDDFNRVLFTKSTKDLEGTEVVKNAVVLVPVGGKQTVGGKVITFESTNTNVVSVNEVGLLTIKSVDRESTARIDIKIDGLLRASYNVVVKTNKVFTIAETQYNIKKEIIETNPQTRINPFELGESTISVNTKADAYQTYYSLTIKATPKEVAAGKTSVLKVQSFSVTLYGKTSANAECAVLYYTQKDSETMTRPIVSVRSGVYDLKKLFMYDSIKIMSYAPTTLRTEDLSFLIDNIDLYTFSYTSTQSNLLDVTINEPTALIDFYYNGYYIPSKQALQLMSVTDGTKYEIHDNKVIVGGSVYTVIDGNVTINNVVFTKSVIVNGVRYGISADNKVYIGNNTYTYYSDNKIRIGGQEYQVNAGKVVIAGKTYNVSGTIISVSEMNMKDFNYSSTIAKEDSTMGDSPITNKQYAVQIYNLNNQPITKFTYVWKFNYSFGANAYEEIDTIDAKTSTIGNVYSDINEFSQLIQRPINVGDNYIITLLRDDEGIKYTDILNLEFKNAEDTTRNLKLDVSLNFGKVVVGGYPYPVVNNKVKINDVDYIVTKKIILDMEYVVSGNKVTVEGEEYTIVDNKVTIQGIEYTVKDGKITIKNKEYVVTNNKVTIKGNEYTVVNNEITYNGLNYKVFDTISYDGETYCIDNHTATATILLNQISGITSYNLDLKNYIFSYKDGSDTETVSFDNLKQYFVGNEISQDKLTFATSIYSVYVTKTIELQAGTSYSLVDLLVEKLGLTQYNEVAKDFSKAYDRTSTKISLSYPSVKYTTNILYMDRIQDLIGIQDIKDLNNIIRDYTITPHGAQNNGDYVHLTFSIGEDRTIYILRIKINPLISIDVTSTTKEIKTKNYLEASSAGASDENKYTAVTLDDLDVQISNGSNVKVLVHNNDYETETGKYILNGQSGNVLDDEGKIKFVATVLGGIEITLKIEDAFGYFKYVDVLLVNDTKIVPSLAGQTPGIFEGDDISIYFRSSDNQYYKYDFLSGNIYFVEEKNTDDSSLVIANIENYYLEKLNFQIFLSGSELVNERDKDEGGVSQYLAKGKVPLLNNEDYGNSDSLNGENLKLTIRVKNDNVLYGLKTEERVISLPISIKKRYKVTVNYETNDKIYLRNNYEDHKLSDFVTILDLKNSTTTTTDINNVASYDGTRPFEVDMNASPYVLYGEKVGNAYLLYTDKNKTNLFAGNIRNYLSLTSNNYRKEDFVFKVQKGITGTDDGVVLTENENYSLQNNGGFAIYSIDEDYFTSIETKTFRILITTSETQQKINLETIVDEVTEVETKTDRIQYTRKTGNKLDATFDALTKATAGSTTFITVTYKGIKHNIAMVYDFIPYVYGVDTSKMYYDESHGVVADGTSENRMVVSSESWLKNIIFVDKVNSIVSYEKNGDMIVSATASPTDLSSFISKANITFEKVSGMGTINANNSLTFDSLVEPSMEVRIIADGVSVGIVKVTLRTYNSLSGTATGVATLSSGKIITFDSLKNVVKTIKPDTTEVNGLLQGGGFEYSIILDDAVGTENKAVLSGSDYSIRNWTGTNLKIAVVYWGKYLGTISIKRDTTDTTKFEISAGVNETERSEVNSKRNPNLNISIASKGVQIYDLLNDFCDITTNEGVEEITGKKIPGETGNYKIILNRFNSTKEQVEISDSNKTLKYTLYLNKNLTSASLEDLFGGLRIKAVASEDVYSWYLLENLDLFTFYKEYSVVGSKITINGVEFDVIENKVTVDGTIYTVVDDKVYVQVKDKLTISDSQTIQIKYKGRDTHFKLNIIVKKSTEALSGEGSLDLLSKDDGRTILTSISYEDWAGVIDSIQDEANKFNVGGVVFNNSSTGGNSTRLVDSRSEFAFSLEFDDKEVSRNNAYIFSTRPALGNNDALVNLQSGDKFTINIYSIYDKAMSDKLYSFTFSAIIGGQATFAIDSNIAALGEKPNLTVYSMSAKDNEIQIEAPLITSRNGFNQVYGKEWFIVGDEDTFKNYETNLANAVKTGFVEYDKEANKVFFNGSAQSEFYEAIGNASIIVPTTYNVESLPSTITNPVTIEITKDAENKVLGYTYSGITYPIKNNKVTIPVPYNFSENSGVVTIKNDVQVPATNGVIYINEGAVSTSNNGGVAYNVSATGLTLKDAEVTAFSYLYFRIVGDVGSQQLYIYFDMNKDGNVGDTDIIYISKPKETLITFFANWAESLELEVSCAEGYSFSGAEIKTIIKNHPEVTKGIVSINGYTLQEIENDALGDTYEDKITLQIMSGSDYPYYASIYEKEVNSKREYLDRSGLTILENSIFQKNGKSYNLTKEDSTDVWFNYDTTDKDWRETLGTRMFGDKNAFTLEEVLRVPNETGTITGNGYVFRSVMTSKSYSTDGSLKVDESKKTFGLKVTVQESQYVTLSTGDQETSFGIKEYEYKTINRSGYYGSDVDYTSGLLMFAKDGTVTVDDVTYASTQYANNIEGLQIIAVDDGILDNEGKSNYLGSSTYSGVVINNQPQVVTINMYNKVLVRMYVNKNTYEKSVFNEINDFILPAGEITWTYFDTPNALSQGESVSIEGKNPQDLYTGTYENNGNPIEKEPYALTYGFVATSEPIYGELETSYIIQITLPQGFEFDPGVASVPGYVSKIDIKGEDGQTAYYGMGKKDGLGYAVNINELNVTANYGYNTANTWNIEESNNINDAQSELKPNTTNVYIRCSTGNNSDIFKVDGGSHPLTTLLDYVRYIETFEEIIGENKVKVSYMSTMNGNGEWIRNMRKVGEGNWETWSDLSGKRKVFSNFALHYRQDGWQTISTSTAFKLKDEMKIPNITADYGHILYSAPTVTTNTNGQDVITYKSVSGIGLTNTQRAFVNSIDSKMTEAMKLLFEKLVLNGKILANLSAEESAEINNFLTTTCGITDADKRAEYISNYCGWKFIREMPVYQLVLTVENPS